MPLKPTVILYHADCLDGFGGAFAAWKRFGDNASYIPVKHQEPIPAGLEHTEIYLIDFSYPKETLLSLEQEAGRLVVLDHHASAKESVEAVKEHVFDLKRSGAGIAWEYFHPQMPLPRMLQYIQDSDLWKFDRPRAREISSLLSSLTFDFSLWDQLLTELETDDGFNKAVEKGAAIASYSKFLLDLLAKDSYEVEFEGYRIRAINIPNYFASAMGNYLAEKFPPFALTWYENSKTLQFSMRGKGEVDLSAIAKRYGGGGHRDAAGFKLPLGSEFPFKRI